MRQVILVPWRTDDGARAAAWFKVCKPRWEALFPTWRIYEGRSPDGPFQRSFAINDAARQADMDGRWDVALIIDADVLLPKANVQEAMDRAKRIGKVTWAHRRWREIDRESTERLLGPKGPGFAEGALGPGGWLAPAFTADLDLIVSKTTRMSWSACIAIRRDAWDRIGGFDERFIGWGHEDGAFMAAAGALVGWDRVEGDVLNLWHPRTPGAGVADKTAPRRYTPQALVNGRLGMRYAIALRRDHGLTDRPDPSPPDVLARDIANLVKYDEEYAAQQTADERRQWAGWWPDIPELVETSRTNRTGTVTVVLHTGGLPENWPERRDYLTRSLESLTAHVSGPIVQRVIYDCWADPAIRAELVELADRHGFYVAGPDSPVDFTGSMQAMWKYLGKRAKGDYILQVEDDFTYERPVDLVPMIEALRENPNVVQMALLRDPCYPDERDTAPIGNILGWPRPAFTFRERWFEHREFFTLNPSLFRKSLTDRSWPAGKHSETLFGTAVFRDKRNVSAFWGQGEEWIRHIGKVRAGVGY